MARMIISREDSNHPVNADAAELRHQMLNPVCDELSEECAIRRARDGARLVDEIRREREAVQFEHVGYAY